MGLAVEECFAEIKEKGKEKETFNQTRFLNRSDNITLFFENTENNVHQSRRGKKIE